MELSVLEKLKHIDPNFVERQRLIGAQVGINVSYPNNAFSYRRISFFNPAIVEWPVSAQEFGLVSEAIETPMLGTKSLESKMGLKTFMLSVRTSNFKNLGVPELPVPLWNGVVLAIATRHSGTPKYNNPKTDPLRVVSYVHATCPVDMAIMEDPRLFLANGHVFMSVHDYHERRYGGCQLIMQLDVIKKTKITPELEGLYCPNGASTNTTSNSRGWKVPCRLSLHEPYGTYWNSHEVFVNSNYTQKYCRWDKQIDALFDRSELIRGRNDLREIQSTHWYKNFVFFKDNQQLHGRAVTPENPIVPEVATMGPLRQQRLRRHVKRHLRHTDIDSSVVTAYSDPEPYVFWMVMMVVPHIVLKIDLSM